MKVHATKNGLINDTISLESAGDRVVVQKVNVSFGERYDISGVAEHLSDAGFPSVRIRNDWRVADYIEGRVVDEPENDKQAVGAAEMVATFHKKAGSYPARNLPGAHSVPELRKDYKRLHSLGLPLRTVHGDLKFSNLILDGDSPKALIDLDTVHRAPVAWDVANMVFSWCGGISGNVRENMAKKVIDAYRNRAFFLEDLELTNLPEFVRVFSLELYYRFSRPGEFVALDEDYRSSRANNALLFSELNIC